MSRPPRADLKRSAPTRKPHDKVLIVCEGEKTEPNYFNGLINFYKLSTAYVTVTGDCGNDPMSVVDKAISKERDERKSTSGHFDRVYCVVDRDRHPNLDQARSAIDRAKPKGRFYFVLSDPCFEFWYLLHFVRSTKPYSPVGRKSAADHLLSELKLHMPGYEKGITDYFASLHERLGTAIKNARIVYQQSKETDCTNPSTEVHLLVEYLINLKK